MKSMNSISELPYCIFSHPVQQQQTAEWPVGKASRVITSAITGLASGVEIPSKAPAQAAKHLKPVINRENFKLCKAETTITGHIIRPSFINHCIK